MHVGRHTITLGTNFTETLIKTKIFVRENAFLLRPQCVRRRVSQDGSIPLTIYSIAALSDHRQGDVANGAHDFDHH